MFPFDQPAATAFYLVLYIGTLALHVVPMNYVLAGSSWLAVASIWEALGGRPSEANRRLMARMRDWMPFALSVAITAGVAPLLFVQVLYKLPFYTANLLLFHRWMAILPVLIVAFYLLYLQKLAGFKTRSPGVRAAVTVGTWLMFGFVGWSWTENHLLSTQGQDAWVRHYAEGQLFYGDWELPPRLALWWLGALPNLAMLLAWQVRRDEHRAPQHRLLAKVALAGFAFAGLAATVYYFALPATARQAVLGVWPYLLAAALTVAAQATLWLFVARGTAMRFGLLLGVTAAAVTSTLAVTTVREARRLAGIDISQFYKEHQQAAAVQGGIAFFVFLAINAGLIAWVVVIARRAAPKVSN